MNRSQRSRRKKKTKTNGDRSERKTRGDKSERRKAKKKDVSERRKKKVSSSATPSSTASGSTGNSTGSTGNTAESTGNTAESNGNTAGQTSIIATEPCNTEKKEKEKEQWSGEETAKKMISNGLFDSSAIVSAYKDLSIDKPPATSCTVFTSNLPKIRAPDFPIPDEKLIKLSHAPENFICAAKVTVPEFSRTMILTQTPDVSEKQNIEDFWRMIFQEEIQSVVIAIMPLECSVTLQQLFPLLNGTFSNHGKMFLNNKKVESSVGMTSYSLEILPDGCSNSLLTTVYHIHNWRQKRGLDNVGELVSTIEKVVKTNENTVFMSMNGIGRAGTMLSLFTSMIHIRKGIEVNTKEIVQKLRSERCGIVDSAEQFGTIHRAMAFWFKNKSQDEEIQKKVNEFAPCVQ
uniref:Tyrosine-protein phosphatase domain-containing protein n=1 Tax=Caenorhabditis tropicalis TaxID=1561998 RepID=A0A1I7UQJ6_9PELO